MKIFHRSGKQHFVAAAILAAAFLFLICGISGFHWITKYHHTADTTPRQVVEQAWQRARDLGSYRFTSDLEAATSPVGKPVPQNSARYERLYLEGSVDLPAQKMELTMWEKGGIMFNTRQGIQVRIEEGKAFGRFASGEWQEMEVSTDGFAPGQDPMAFLAGAKDFYLAGSGAVDLPTPEGTASLQYNRYGFTIDGMEFARKLRPQLEQQMIRAGDLPPGVTLDIAEAYRGFSGTGEVWIDEFGLPLRLTVDLIYPEQYGEQSHATVRTDFSGFPDASEAASSFISRSLIWFQRTLGLPTTNAGWNYFGIQAGLFVLCIGVVLVLMTRSRSRVNFNHLRHCYHSFDAGVADQGKPANPGIYRESPGRTSEGA